MKLSHALAISILALSLARSASAAYCVNKDLINLGPTAYDLGVLITGNQPLTWRYDGYPAARFANFTLVPAGANEFLHWQNLKGTNAPILTGDLIHVGWCTANRNNIVDMWWTDRTGGRVAGSVVYNLTAHHVYSAGRLHLLFTHEFQTANPIVISNVYYALSSAEWPLDQLNRENQSLAAQLVPLPGGSSFSVAPGATVDVPVPDGVQGQWIVLRYAVDGAGNQAQSQDYVQFQIQ